MGLSVNFKTQRGVITNRKFQSGEGVSIYGKATTLSGVINPGTTIRIEISDSFGNSYFFKDTFTDIWGDYASWFLTPSDNKNLMVTVYASYPVSGQDKTVIPIAVGNVNPKPLPMPESEFSLLNFLPIAFIGLAVLIIMKK
jgi:hypothetical protein